jgi:hypothetical protein
VEAHLLEDCVVLALHGMKVLQTLHRLPC